tara:strand:+ start:1158 stop:2114 length:957 start_codon:yes stop_codon:yes gene_type:complete
MLPNLSMLTEESDDVPAAAKRTRPLLTVTETTEVLASSISILEMLLAEFSHGLLTLWVYSPSALRADWDDDADASDEHTVLRVRVEQLSHKALYALALFERERLLLHANERWTRVSTFLEMIKLDIFNSDAMRSKCMAFLKQYLEEREIPVDTPPASMWSTDLVYGEYFSVRNQQHLSGHYNKMLRVLSVHNRPDACVGVIMLKDDLPKQYGNSELPQWTMIGVLTCPFYRTYQGGAATAILEHLKKRINSQTVVETIYVDILDSAPDFWKHLLNNTGFIDCPSCKLSGRREQKMLRKLEKRRHLNAERTSSTNSSFK